jgi:hypothetical protein
MKRINRNSATIAISNLYQTKFCAGMVISLPKIPVNPKINTVR